MAKRHSVPEIIATHLSFDMSEMREYAYQPGHYTCALFAVGDFYYAAPASEGKLPKEWNWHDVGTEFGRKIYRAHMNDDCVES